MNLEQRISDLNQRYEQAKDTRKRAEWRMEELEREEKELNAKIKALGFNPDTLEEEIERKEGEILRLLDEAEKLLPEDRS